MSKKISRREFVENSAKTVAAGALLASGVARAAKAAPKSKVVEVTSKAVSKGRKIDPKKVREMVQKGMQALTGADEPFKKLFSPKDKVGLKINCLGRPRIFTHMEVIDAFAAELQAAGVKAENIVVWDRFGRQMTDCGFKMNPKGPGVRYHYGEYQMDDKNAYISTQDSTMSRSGGSPASKLSKIFTKDCNKHINLAILKDHGLAGVTLCLKNIAFGVCDNNRRFHGRDNIGPFISDFCSQKGIMDKFTLHVLDGLEGCYDDGPCPGDEDLIFTHNTIWFTNDPVAVDTMGTQVIEAQRKKKGLKSLKKSGRHPRHIEMSSKLGLGNSDPARMDIEKIAL
jgi:uncharacterized protein (DUF362 family)